MINPINDSSPNFSLHSSETFIDNQISNATLNAKITPPVFDIGFIPLKPSDEDEVIGNIIII